ncbi:MAG: heme-degrading domain-containing protein [Alphaproteobacteria bacterium]|uniref:heme-degrading domain-containing protein n=1 Tax=Aestuariivirga sp. TaxID=2650926 RepID=UPI0030163090|nr:heme-degrading domain-containing protein [Alphaproteobacteria bacterium]
MSLESDIARITRQEEELRFERFSEADAWALGSLMRKHAEERKIPFVIDIRIGNRPLFYTALPGSTPENPDWVRRKVNTVYRFHKSSYRVGREHQLSGKAFDASRGIDPMDHAPAGGGFPIHLKGTGIVGVVTVSGVPQREDHGFVVEMLCRFLGVEHAMLELGPETN